MERFDKIKQTHLDMLVHPKDCEFCYMLDTIKDYSLLIKALQKDLSTLRLEHGNSKEPTKLENALGSSGNLDCFILQPTCHLPIMDSAVGAKLF